MVREYCRYGVNCNNKNCKLKHSKGRFLDGTATVEFDQSKKDAFDQKIKQREARRQLQLQSRADPSEPPADIDFEAVREEREPSYSEILDGAPSNMPNQNDSRVSSQSMQPSKSAAKVSHPKQPSKGPAKDSQSKQPSKVSKKKSSKQENTSKTHRKKLTNSKGPRSSKQGKQASQPLAINTKSHKSMASRTKSKLKHLQRIQLTMNLTKSTYSDDRAAYYQGPWEIRKSGVSVAAGNIVAFKKTEIVPELVRQVQYFFDNAI